MRAVVLGDTPWSLRVADGWPEPELGSGQVMVRVRGVGICGSDLALISHARRAPAYPWVLGHEAFGEIVAAGPGADASRVGQRVVIEPNYPCLRCPACRAGLHLDVPGPGAGRLHRAGAAGRVRGRALGLRVAGPRPLVRRRRGLRRAADGGAGRDQAQRHRAGRQLPGRGGGLAGRAALPGPGRPRGHPARPRAGRRPARAGGVARREGGRARRRRLRHDLRDVRGGGGPRRRPSAGPRPGRRWS